MSSTEKKILFVLPWHESGGAGVEQQVSLLGTNLPTDRFDIQIFKVSGRIRSAIIPLAKHIREHNPDIVVGNVLPVCAIAILSKFISGSDFKIISINHGMDFMSLKERILARFVAKFSDKFVAVSGALKDNLLKLLGNGTDIEVVYNAFDFTKIEELTKEDLTHKEKLMLDDTQYIVYVGRLDERQKAISVLLNAIYILIKKRGLNLRLLLIGDGRDRANLEVLTNKLNIQKSIHFLGWQANPYNYIARSGCLVLPSNFEGFGRVLVEAMSLGVPVVSTDCKSGPAEILADGEYGKLVPVSNQELLASAIEDTLHNPINEDVLKSRAHDFSIKQSTDKFITIIESL